MKATSSLTFKVGFDRSLIWYRGKSVRYLVVEAQAPTVEPDPQAAALPLNLALVVDASGSMAGAPLQAAKQAARGVAAALQAQDLLSVVAFDSQVSTLIDGVAADEDGRRAADAALAHLEAGSATNLSGGWLQGAECVARSMSDGQRRRCRTVLLTDGHANQGLVEPEVLAGHAANLLQHGISSSTVGIGDGYSADQIQAIADAGGGRMHDAERPEEIIEVVLAELREMGQEVLEQIELTLHIPSGVRITPLSGFPSGPQADGFRCSLGALPSGGSRKAVFQFELPAGREDQTLDFSVHASARRPGAEQAEFTAPIAVQLTYARGQANKAQARDPAASRASAEAWQASVIREAVQLNRQGDYRRAADLITRQLRYFERYCSGLGDCDDLLQGLRAAARRIHRPMRERARKEIDLAMYKRSRSERDLRVSSRPNWDQFLQE
jgi:Ca-activated chloride channel family protein